MLTSLRDGLWLGVIKWIKPFSLPSCSLIKVFITAIESNLEQIKWETKCQLFYCGPESKTQYKVSHILYADTQVLDSPSGPSRSSWPFFEFIIVELLSLPSWVGEKLCLYHIVIRSRSDGVWLLPALRALPTSAIAVTTVLCVSYLQILWAWYQAPYFIHGSQLLPCHLWCLICVSLLPLCWCYWYGLTESLGNVFYLYPITCFFVMLGSWWVKYQEGKLKLTYTHLNTWWRQTVLNEMKCTVWL